MSEFQLQFAAKFRRLAPRLLEQQMWCWGQDIRRKPNNLLLDYGFERYRAPHDPDLSSCYQLLCYPNYQIVLWGFGAYVGSSDGGIYLRRQAQSFQPLYNPTPFLPLNTWLSAPDGNPPRSITACTSTCTQIVAFMQWIASYEQWIVEQVGATYRQHILTAWKHKLAVEAAAMPTTWLELAALCAEAVIIESRKVERAS